MTESGDQVQKLLSALSKHSDLVAEAFEGSVHGGDRQRNAAVEALFGLGVLKPYEEDSYRLNPRLREFLADHFSSYHAFQALRRVFGTMQQAQEQWRELRQLKAAGANRDALRLYAALDDSIVEIAYSIEHNLSMLHSLLSTQYGNVDDLSSKLRQNRYYARQVVQFLRDVEGVDAFAERVAEESIASGMPEVRQLVTRRLGARCLNWTSQIKDAQSVISKRLFEAKLMETRLKRLSRFSLWLTRHRTADGWALPVDESATTSLFRPERIDLRLQPDVTDTDPVVWDNLLIAVSRLPEKPGPRAQPPEEAPQMLMEDEEEIAEPDDPIERALRELASSIRASKEPISLLGWKGDRQELAGLDNEAWLVFCSMQLKSGGMQLEFLSDAEFDPFPINESFYDVLARRPLSEAA
jgi:hypothetical protein